MTTRHAHTQELARYWQRARENERIAYHALIASLSENQRKAYEYVTEDKPLDQYLVTASEVAENLGWSIQYASTVLKELVDYGLLTRAKQWADSGREFVYQKN